MPGRKIKICREPNCNDEGKTNGYCRFHYLKNWRILKKEQAKKSAERLNRYVEGICKKNPDDFLSVVKDNLRRGETPDLEPETPAADDMERALSEMDADHVSLDRIVNQMRLHDKF